MKKELQAHGVLLFDGICNLCSGLVIFIVKRDRAGYFRFAALQSQTGRELSRDCALTGTMIDTVVLLEGGKCYTRSTAALRVCRHLPSLWKLLYLFILVPRPLRDWIYDFVARRRYGWFGQKDHCPVPAPDIADRFL